MTTVEHDIECEHFAEAASLAALVQQQWQEIDRLQEGTAMDFFTELADRLTEMTQHRAMSEEERQDLREAAAILRTLGRTNPVDNSTP